MAIWSTAYGVQFHYVFRSAGTPCGRPKCLPAVLLGDFFEGHSCGRQTSARCAPTTPNRRGHRGAGKKLC
eukprot:7320507-Pyramimonas_sp.AAC.1